jgi:hypothetical protein
VLILLSLFAGPFLSGIIVEIVGAFLGVFAAVVLGEILKLRQDSQLAKRVQEDLIEELKTILRAGKRDPDQAGGYEIAYWDASVAGGELRVLDRNVRRRLVTAYNAIMVYNHATDMRTEAAMQPGISAGEKAIYVQRVIDSHKKTLAIVSMILARLEGELKRKKAYEVGVQKRSS